jgi:glucose dehydrogenase
VKRTWTATAAAVMISIAGQGCGDDENGTDAGPMDAGAHDSGAAATTIDGGGMDAQVASRKLGPPPEVVAAAKEWPNTNRDYAGTRATFDSKIKASNVSTLTQAWAFDLPGGGTFGAATAAPIVLNGVVYYVDMQSNVFAIDATTGKQKWAKMYQAAASGPNGLAVGWGKVFVPSSDHEFVALDINTGNELWKAPIVVPKNGGIGIAPVAYDELVYLSTEPVSTTSSYLGGVNGTFYALDQATGAVVWSFATVEDSSLWGHSDINSGGGAWYPPTIDVERDVMYWGVGNPAPYPGTEQFPSGSIRPGNNLYTSSVTFRIRRFPSA